jgi:hypothetical protein
MKKFHLRQNLGVIFESFKGKTVEEFFLCFFFGGGGAVFLEGDFNLILL